MFTKNEIIAGLILSILFGCYSSNITVKITYGGGYYGFTTIVR